jgi:hypothetical protein
MHTKVLWPTRVAVLDLLAMRTDTWTTTFFALPAYTRVWTDLSSVTRLACMPSSSMHTQTGATTLLAVINLSTVITELTTVAFDADRTPFTMVTDTFTRTIATKVRTASMDTICTAATCFRHGVLSFSIYFYVSSSLARSRDVTGVTGTT